MISRAQRHAQWPVGNLLAIGWVLIRARRIAPHRAFMIAAFVTSSLFLVSYVIYHAQVGSVRFTRGGLVRPVYYACSSHMSPWRPPCRPSQW